MQYVIQYMCIFTYGMACAYATSAICIAFPAGTLCTCAYIERDCPVPFRKTPGILCDVPPSGNQAGSCLHAWECQSIAVSKIEGMVDMQQQI